MTLGTATLTAMIGYWLNLDAELELERPRGYRQSPRVAARIEGLRPRLLHLLGPSGRVLGHDPLPAGSRAIAWCPTPSALEAIERRGMVPCAHPTLDVLQRVNHRRFCAELGQTLEGATLVGDMPHLRSLVQQPTPTGDWVLKRPFGFAGRERRRAIGGVLDESTEGFARATFDAGEVLQVEPWLARDVDVSLHGFVYRDGRVALTAPVVQHCDAMGRFTHAGGDARDALGKAWVGAFTSEAERVGVALYAAGYFGPFGIDGFTYRDARGAVQLNPRSEINARFTMAYRWPDGVDPAADDFP